MEAGNGKRENEKKKKDFFLNNGVRTKNGLGSKIGMDPGPRSPNNEFVESRKES